MFIDYAPKNVKFYFIYKALAHPERNGYLQPFSLKERLMHVKEAQRTLGSKIPWICDTIKNDLKHALGNRPNPEFIIGPDLKIVVKRRWSSPSQLRKDLEKLVGKVDKPTRVADLNMKTQPPYKVAAKGVVQRLSLPRNLRAVKIEPVKKENGQPFYVKLRAEADSGLLRDGKGKLYLGFHLDPLYKVHWNNLTKPIKVTLHAPDGMTLSQTTLQGPKVKEAADADPREFLIDVEGAQSRKPLKLSVHYFACNDEAGWCKSVSQEYLVYFQSDPDGGRARRGRGFGGFAGRGGAGGFTRSMPLIEAIDTNGDGELSAEEIKNAAAALKKLDKDKNGRLTPDELRPRSGGFGGRSGGFGRGGFGGPPGGFDIVARIMSNDKNKDGKVTKQELPESMHRILERADTNKDGAIDKKEAEAMAERFRRRSGGRGRESRPDRSQRRRPPRADGGK